VRDRDDRKEIRNSGICLVMLGLERTWGDGEGVVFRSFEEDFSLQPILLDAKSGRPSLILT